MKLWSRGLGKTELKLDCRYYEVRKDPNGKDVIIIGNITDPVNWEFRAIVEPEDIAGMMKLFFTMPLIKLVLKNIYQYVLYLINKEKFVDPDRENLEENVMKAYDQMMNGRRRPTHLRTQS